MTDQLTDDQIFEFKEAFSLFDKDGDASSTQHRPVQLPRYGQAFKCLDDRVNAVVVAAAPSQNGKSSSGKRKKKANGSSHNGKKEEVDTTSVLQEYKQPLVWIDLEMTGGLQLTQHSTDQFSCRDMDKLYNAFSALDVDADDDRVNAVVAGAAPSQNGKSSSGKSKEKANGSSHNGEKEEAATSVLQEFKQPLVWIDLEMTGKILL